MSPLTLKGFLFQLNLCTGLFDGLLQVLSLVLRKTFLDGCRCTVNEILSLFQTETTSLLDCLYNLELSSTYLSEDNIERCLLLSCSSIATSCRTSSYSNSCSSRLNTILFLQDICQLVYFFYSKVYQLFCNSFNICHFYLNFNCF